MAKKKSVGNYTNVVVVHCKPLNDQWECEFDRTPVCLTSRENAERAYGGRCYEHYAVMPNGRFTRVKECDY